MRRVPVALFLSLFLLACQRSETARVTRRGDSLRVSRGPIAIPIGTTCTVPLAGGKLLFDQTLHTAPFDLKVTFTYDAPARLPHAWPSGNWCDSLAARVQQIAASAVADAGDIYQSPRDTGSVIAGRLQRELGLQTSSISTRFDLPPGWGRTRPVAAIARLARPAPPLIFIGLDGADWQLLDDYIARGIMPNLARLVHEGTSGFLTTEHPPLSPILWTTMMTGTSPLQHQILDFTRFNPVTGKREPITSDERRVPAIWNMITMAGKSVDVFGLWATFPAEPVHGVMVSDRLFTFLYSEASPPPGVAFPPSEDAQTRAVVAAAEKSIDLHVLESFLPWLEAAQYDDILREQNPYEEPGSALRRILIDTEVYRRLGIEAVSRSIPDLTIVYFEGTDTIGHIFAPYAPPKQPEVTQQDYDRYHHVPELYFHHIDVILGQFLAAAERHHARLMLASDHGFQWKEGRPTTISSFATATAAKWHRQEGIVLLWGPGISATRGHTLHGTIRQVCATLLDLCGLPAGTNVAPALSRRQERPRADYSRYFQPFTPAAATTSGSNEELAKLRALGYIGGNEPFGQRRAAAGGATKTAGSYNNEGLVLKSEGRIREAMQAFDRALQIDPNLASAAWNLSDLLFAQQQDLPRADELLIRALHNGLPEAPKYVIERAIHYQRGGHAGRSLKLLEQAVNARPDDAELHMFRGRYRVELRDCAGALEDFRVAARLQPNDPVAFASAGLAEICLGDRAGAEVDFRRSLELNPNQPMLRRFMSPGRSD